MQFSENSRVWIYQANREFTTNELIQLQQQLQHFTSAWTAHNHQLKATAEIRYNRFIVLIVDETQAGASGCSIDKSVRFMHEIEQAYHINLFDRFDIAYREGAQVLSANRAQFEQLVQQHHVNEDTIVFNNLVQTLKELNTRWEIPFKESWHQQLFGSLLP